VPPSPLLGRGRAADFRTRSRCRLCQAWHGAPTLTGVRCRVARLSLLIGVRDLLAEGEAGLAVLFDDKAAGPCTPPEEAVRTRFSLARGASGAEVKLACHRPRKVGALTRRPRGRARPHDTRPRTHPQPPPPFGDAVLVDLSVPCSVRALGRVLFKQNSEFQAAWCDQLRATDVRELPWELKPGGGADGGNVALRDVHMATPPPPAWGYLVGSTPIASRRSQTLLRAHDGRCLWVEEVNHLNMPFGNTFHTALQYYLAAEGEGGRACRLRVTFKLIFSMRAAAMKGVLTSMVRGEHEKIFAQWNTALAKFLAGCVRARPAARTQDAPLCAG
jgi:hypothetical protein